MFRKNTRDLRRLTFVSCYGPSFFLVDYIFILYQVNTQQRTYNTFISMLFGLKPEYCGDIDLVYPVL